MAQATRVQLGSHVDYTPGANVTAGDVVVQSELVGVAERDITSGELGAIAVDGVFDFAKAGAAGVVFAAGDLVYWDDTNNLAVTTSGAGANKLIGKAVEAAADADTTVRAKLDQ